MFPDLRLVGEVVKVRESVDVYVMVGDVVMVGESAVGELTVGQTTIGKKT